MSLPSFNLPGKNISTDKQMSMMRSYLGQLKDETESELYNIRWDNLSKDLRDKIEALDYDIQQTSSYSEDLVGTLNASVISAGYIKADYIIADGMLTNTMTAALLKSNYLTTNQLFADQAFIDEVNALVGKFNYVTADYVKTSILTSQYIESNIVTANHINAAFNGSSRLDAKSASITTLYNSKLVVTLGDQSYTLVPNVVNGYVMLTVRQ